MPCLLQAFNNCFVSDEICELMGLCKRVQRHLIKSILSLKNTHENVFLTAIASSSTLTWFTYQIRPSLCIFGLTCSSYIGDPQSVFFLSANGETSHLLFSPRDSSLPTRLPISHPTLSLPRCLGNTYQIPI